MDKFDVSPRSIEGFKIQEAYRKTLPDCEGKEAGVKTSMWMFTANAELGGHSPVTAIKAGRTEDVWKLIERIK